MPRYHAPYVLIKQRSPKGKTVWYYRLYGEKTKRSTGKALKHRAQEYVEQEILGARPVDTMPLKIYLEPFYDWDRCPHLTRIRPEREHGVTRRYARIKRQTMKGQIFSDPIAKMRMGEITRGDLLAFRGRLLEKGLASSTVNHVMGILKTAYREGLIREQLSRDPTLGIGNVKLPPRRRGIFSVEELQALFPDRGLGPWPDLRTYCAFLLAASTGMRRGEVLALRWENVDLRAGAVAVAEAWKDRDITGIPKGGRTRDCPFISAICPWMDR